MRRINICFLAVVLNSFRNLRKAIVYYPSRKKKKITEAMTVGTNWLFAIFAIGQESGLDYCHFFLTMVGEFRKGREREIAKNTLETKWTSTKELSLVLLGIILFFSF